MTIEYPTPTGTGYRVSRLSQGVFFAETQRVAGFPQCPGGTANISWDTLSHWDGVGNQDERDAWDTWDKRDSWDSWDVGCALSFSQSCNLAFRAAPTTTNPPKIKARLITVRFALRAFF